MDPKDIDAERVVRALAKRPDLLREVTELLVGPPPEPNPIPVFTYEYSSTTTAPSTKTPGLDGCEILGLAFPLDAPLGRYKVLAMFDVPKDHVYLYLNGEDTHASGNGIYMEKVIDTRDVEPANERLAALGSWDFRLTLQTRTCLTLVRVESAEIVATYLGQ